MINFVYKMNFNLCHFLCLDVFASGTWLNNAFRAGGEQIFIALFELACTHKRTSFHIFTIKIAHCTIKPSKNSSNTMVLKNARARARSTSISLACWWYASPRGWHSKQHGRQLCIFVLFYFYYFLFALIQFLYLALRHQLRY